MSASGSKSERKAETNSRVAMMESIILAKLYTDGHIVVDEKEKTVKIDSRKSVLSKAYQDSSYPDISRVIQKVHTGLEMQGYVVTRVLESGRVEGV